MQFARYDLVSSVALTPLPACPQDIFSAACTSKALSKLLSASNRSLWPQFVAQNVPHLPSEEPYQQAVLAWRRRRNWLSTKSMVPSGIFPIPNSEFITSVNDLKLLQRNRAFIQLYDRSVVFDCAQRSAIATWKYVGSRPSWCHPINSELLYSLTTSPDRRTAYLSVQTPRWQPATTITVPLSLPLGAGGASVSDHFVALSCGVIVDVAAEKPLCAYSWSGDWQTPLFSRFNPNILHTLSLNEFRMFDLRTPFAEGALAAVAGVPITFVGRACSLVQPSENLVRRNTCPPSF